MSGTARAIVLSAYQPTNIPQVGTPVPLSWPSKRVGETLGYDLDLTNRLAENDDIVSIAITVLPDVVGGLTVIGRLISGAMAAGHFSAGQAGTTYAVTISASTAGGDLFQETINLMVTS